MKGKRIALLSCLIALVVLVCGCGSKESKLICKQSTNGVDITFNVDFKGNMVSAMSFDYDMDLSKYNDKQIEALGEQDFCTSVKNSMTEYKDAFTDCKQKVENKNLNVSSVLDVDKIAKNVLDKMTSPEDAKKDIENKGYTCEIQ